MKKVWRTESSCFVSRKDPATSFCWKPCCWCGFDCFYGFIPFRCFNWYNKECPCFAGFSSLVRLVLIFDYRPLQSYSSRFVSCSTVHRCKSQHVAATTKLRPGHAFVGYTMLRIVVLFHHKLSCSIFSTSFCNFENVNSRYIIFIS